jgi:apolipoprotein N-acyltransferase
MLDFKRMRQIPLRLWAMAALSGILQVLPFPIAGPAPIWRTAFCWIALLPLLWALLGNNKTGNPLTVVQGTLLGYVCGFIWYLGNCYWIYQTMYLYGGLPKPVAAAILILFCLYLGLYHALFGTLVSTFHRRFSRQSTLLLVPFAWVAVELARARITGLPWDLLGISQVDNPLLTRLAPITGAYGLSFIIAAVNALWLVRISVRERRFTRPLLTIAGVVIIVLYVLGLRSIATPRNSPTTATATLVQENLEVGAANTGPHQTREQLISSFSDLSRNPAHTELNGIPGLPGTRTLSLREFPYVVPTSGPGYQPADLIVWPESPSGFRTDDPEFTREMHQLADSTHALLIVGSLGLVPNPNPTAERPYFLYDSAAFFVANDDIGMPRYDKIHLVPWGEYIPFKRFFFFADKLTAGVGDMDPGTDRRVFRINDHVYGTFVCYESIFADEVRQFVKNGAEVLVNISDDGWYGDTSAPWQHLNMVRMRAIENHRWILRSTNTGITAAINPYGRVTVAAPRHQRTSIRVHFGYEHDLTFYSRYGDLFAYACALITTLALALKLGAPRPASGTWVPAASRADAVN